jgi:hypothetical protein
MGAEPSATATDVAAEIIELVRATPVGGHRDDTSGLVMLAAYALGFRRLVAIRDLAEKNAGAEAMILTRSLLSLVGRAAYVDAPTDPEERRRRFLQYQAQDLRETIRTVERLETAGFDPGADLERFRRDLAEIGDVGTLPGDTELLRDHTGLARFHARIYGPGSDHVHFSTYAALSNIHGVEELDLDTGDAELADEALRLALVTFGRLLELSERAVRHGLNDEAVRRVGKLFGHGEGTDAA